MLVERVGEWLHDGVRACAGGRWKGSGSDCMIGKNEIPER